LRAFKKHGVFWQTLPKNVKSKEPKYFILALLILSMSVISVHLILKMTLKQA